ncbi:hypothetical protein CQA07_22195 [Klebsiella pneumoniae]|nr:hypothetical protein CTI55_04130 [Klebsiella pneumoniae]OCN20254.1 hypothetical protein AN662_0205875 [Klebsiella pneumoniae subsp. pneumoniae]ATR03071.1 hypothetical protein CTI56_04130 [Klebsiella pneumoniae]ATR08469.1 hypothetical protein CTI57_04125 [Klebsiella pneumoniae]ATR14196.1 hypothetical protein CTI58_04130 [Klebsiella pneumoniae]
MLYLQPPGGVVSLLLKGIILLIIMTGKQLTMIMAQRNLIWAMVFMLVRQRLLFRKRFIYIKRILVC